MTDVIAGRFALCDPIARGGSGVVWRAYDRRTEKYCAAKVLRRRDAGDLLRFVREQSVRLTHRNVLTPYSWAAEDSHVVIASELVDGGSLATLLGHAGRLHEATVAAVLDQLLAALEAVHAAGLVHRDVKPANLLLRASGTGPLQVLLSDFGLAMGETDARLTQVGMIVGTPGYVAPELFTGTAAVDAGQDLYAAGRVAAALLTGAEPAAGTDVNLAAVRDPALRDLIQALTALAPSRRPPSAAAARHWLRQHVRAQSCPHTRDGEPIDVRPQLPALPEFEDDPELSPIPMAAAVTGQVHARPGDTQLASTAPAPRHRHRRRWLPAAGAAVLIGAGATVATVLMTSGGSSPPSTTGPLRVVRAGATCDWADQNDQARSPGGDALTCQLVGNRYLWR